MRYYEDLYNHQYRWSTTKNDEGYFMAGIYKFKSINSWGNYKLYKKRVFRKRKDAKAWCLKSYLKAKTRQRTVINEREERKKEKKMLKPVLSKEELKFKKLQGDIVRWNDVLKRTDTKMKRLITHKTTYEKKIQSNIRKIEKLVMAV